MSGTILADRVQQQTTTTGTGTVTLTGSITGMQSFLTGIGSGNVCGYTIIGGSQWETGYGTFTAGGSDTLTRDIVLDSSSGGSPISFSSGTKDVYAGIPANALGPGIGGQWKQKSSTNYTVNIDDNGDTISMDAAGTTRIVTLPVYTSLPDGFQVTIRKHDTNALGYGYIVISPSGSDYVESPGGVSPILRRQGSSVTLRLYHKPLLPSGTVGFWTIVGQGGTNLPDHGIVYQNGAQNAVSATLTKLIELKDVHHGRVSSDNVQANWSNSVNTLNINDHDMRYEIFARVEVASLAAGVYGWAEIQGGNNKLRGARTYCHTASGTSAFIVSGIVDVDDGDSLSLWVYQSDGSDRAISYNDEQTFLMWNALTNSMSIQ